MPRRYEKHGCTNMKLYQVWASMWSRCENPKDRNFGRYGSRGISVCERWESFALFLEDMGEPPAGHTLDREDNNKGYSPDNCRWATHKQQQRNMRSNFIVTAFGESKCLSAWVEDPRCSVCYMSVHVRLRNGWPAERAISSPDTRWKVA